MMRMSDRQTVRGLALVSIVMLIAATALRASLPSPFAPRVHVRWSAGLSAERRAALEGELSLQRGESRAVDTWEYDLTDPEPASVARLIAHPDVVDTHYLERASGRVSADAPRGRVRLSGRPLATVVHSLFFDWFLGFWACSILVSALWLSRPEGA